MKQRVFDEIEMISHHENNINKGVSIFGSARINSNSHYYNTTKILAKKLSHSGYQIISGGGPGIMKAAIEGASDAGTKSIGLNIELPFEQETLPNKKKSITFKYFMTRKLAFAKYSSAFIVMPGGIGTLDELFEMLTLIQTKKMESKKYSYFVLNFGKD